MTDEMAFEDFCEAVGLARELHPEWRPGQAWFNELCRYRPDLSERIRTTDLDPFHYDPKDRKRLLYFINWVKFHWNERAEG